MLEEPKHAGNMNLKLSMILLCTLLFIACNTNSQSETKKQSPELAAANGMSKILEQSTEYLITGSSVGSFSRGDMIDPMREYGNAKLVEVKVGKTTETKVPYYSFVRKGVEELRIIPALDPRTNTYTQIIGSIYTKSSMYKDKRGIHVGSSVSEVLLTYPNSYLYYDISSNQVIISNEGHGAQYIASNTSLKEDQVIKAGKIAENLVNSDAKIIQIRIVRTVQENQDAQKNKMTEEKEIIAKYLESISGKYYLKGFSENYYKIHNMQGTFYVSECFEGDCNNRGKILGVSKNMNGFESLELEGISGEMVPTWSLKSTNTIKELFVRDYDAEEDKWISRVFEKSEL